MILTATSRIEGTAILRHHDLVTADAIVDARKTFRRPGTRRASATSNRLCGTEKYASRYRQPDPAGSDNLPTASSTTSNRSTDPPIGTPAIRARATPRTGHIRILILSARNQPRAAPLAHLLDEQREAERNALAKNPRAGHVELGQRQVELLELTRRDPQLQCPIQRFSVRFPDGSQRHRTTSSPHAPGAPASWTCSSPRTDTPASAPAAATGPQPVRPAACRTPGRARRPRHRRCHRAPRRAPGRAGEEPHRDPPRTSGAAPHAQRARSPATPKPPGPDPAPCADGPAPDAPQPRSAGAGRLHQPQVPEPFQRLHGDRHALGNRQAHDLETIGTIAVGQRVAGLDGLDSRRRQEHDHALHLHENLQPDHGQDRPERAKVHGAPKTVH